ncbi:chitin synthase chs-2-like [Rhynchophorus ferrugineus]|uniref:chitin synthase chs-2-like n=1 Tax=Rhynchophorus ferrugineus TaxID=354439 RepID=UPI003FCDA5E8
MGYDDDYYDEDENDDEDSLLAATERQGEEVKPWDSFKVLHRKAETGSLAESKWIDNGVKVLKTFTIGVVSLIVLCSAVTSKLTLFLMTSQIKKNITRPYCNLVLDNTRSYNFIVPDVERTTWIWLLMFAYFAPEFGTFFRSLRILIFKSWDLPSLWDFLLLLMTESFPAIGSSLLIFNILPEMDVIRGAMLTNALCFFPALEFTLRHINKLYNKDNWFLLTLDVFALLAQISGFIAWPIIEENQVLWLIPVASAMISFGWWENFIFEDTPVKLFRIIAQAKKDFPNSKYFSYAIVSVVKCVLFLATAVISIYIREGDVSFMFDEFFEAFSEHKMVINEIIPQVSGSNVSTSDGVSTGGTEYITNSILYQLIILGVNIATTYICYAFAKFACKIMIQASSFAFPLNLTVPVLITTLVAICGPFAKDSCAYFETFPREITYLFFNTPPLLYLKDFVGHQHAWIWLAWLLSQFWITQFIWSNKNSKLSTTEQLFMRPMYDAFLIDQSLALNRRNVVDRIIKVKAEATEETTEVDEDKITKIYACGTMWHETREEMMEFLKTILRMDEDQAAHRIVKQYLRIPVESHYEWETHIFFDDAFVRKSKDDNDPHVNSYVLDLVTTIGEAATEVHKTTVRIRPPVIYPTPYGGRLVWVLPGKTKMIAHLKDKAKIRAKKRWSQVMYMYYLLGHRIMDNEEFTPERVKVISKNTYIMALDGDIDFQPEAVHLLVQYMKKNDSLGAACGRIHPVGSGTIAWYQVFEYAVGHWMQKATEHVIGCVLCSPGCFSLFRASALMDHNVMARYTTRSEEARHYVQYDQGEDRWLCTLLLQRGYRVEYSAASDAYTHCPEGFNEFYNQRRRWMPSTMANILDLLQDSKHIIKVNDNISTLYIFYQVVLMIGTVIGPGTIFLMLVGAFVTAFGLNQWSAFMYNLIPIAIFVLTCIFCDSNTQLTVAAAISGFYGLVMMAVLIGVVMQINQDGILAPSSLFFFIMMGEYIVAAIIHPKEFYCLKYGIIYLVTVPSMYLLLVIYSVFNMNNVSWGTREVTVVANKSEGAQEEKKEEPIKKALSPVISMVYKVRDFFADCFSDSKHLVLISNSLVNIEQKTGHIEQRIDYLEKITLDPEMAEPRKTMSKRKTTIVEGARASRLSVRPRASTMRPSTLNPPSVSFQGDTIADDYDYYDDEESIGMPDDLQNNSWFYDGDLIRGNVTYLDKKEEIFWKELLDKYLHPIEDNKEKVARDLKDLRDKMVMSFFMLNSLFVLVVFLLTLQKDLIHLKWPFNPTVNFTYTGTSTANEILLTKTRLELEPIGFVFLIFFFGLMAVQFVAMLLHRFGTYAQIMANTELNFNLFDTKIENMTEDELFEGDPIRVFRKLIKLKGVNDDDENEDVNSHVTRRSTVALLMQNKNKKRAVINDLDTAFAARMKKFRNNEKCDVAIPRKTLVAINRRRTTVLKRKSEMLAFHPSDYRTKQLIPEEDHNDGMTYEMDNLGYDHNPESTT